MREKSASEYGYEPFVAIPRTSSPPEQKLARPRFWDRLLLSVGSLVVLVGVAGGLSPHMRGRFALLWPDDGSATWFAAGVSISTMALLVYLVLQRWDVKLAEHKINQLKYDVQERTRRHWNQLYGLIDVSRLVGHRTDLDSIFAGIASTCVGSFDGDSVSLMLYEKDTNELVIRSAAGRFAVADIIGRRCPLDEGLAGWAARRREPVLLNSNEDATRYPGIVLRDKEIQASMVMPIIVRNELVGVINVSSRNEEISYTHEDLRTLEVFAENAGSCIRHVEQVTWLRKMVDKSRNPRAEEPV